MPLNINDEDSINNLLIQIDNSIQYGEDLEPKEPKWSEEDFEHEEEEEGEDDWNGETNKYV